MKERLLLILTAIIFAAALIFVIAGIVQNISTFRAAGIILSLIGNSINLVVHTISAKKRKNS